MILIITANDEQAERVSLADVTVSGAELLLETTTSEKIPFRVHMSPTEVQLLRPDPGLVYHLPAAQSADLGLTITVIE